MKITPAIFFVVALLLLSVGATRADWERRIIEDPLTQDIIKLRLFATPHGIPHKPFRGFTALIYDCDNTYPYGGVFFIRTSFPLVSQKEITDGGFTIDNITLRVAIRSVAQPIQFVNWFRTESPPEVNDYHAFKRNEDDEIVKYAGYDFAGVKNRDLNEIKIELPTHAGDIVFTYDISGFPANPCTINPTR